MLLCVCMIIILKMLQVLICKILTSIPVDFLFHSLTMAMGVVWLMSIVIALMKYLLDNGNKPKYNILRTAKTSFLAVTLAIMAILPGVVKLFRQPIVVMPRRPTVFCVDKEEANGFYMFAIPFGIILLLGNLMLIYITWKTKQVSMYTYRNRDIREL